MRERKLGGDKRLGLLIHDALETIVGVGSSRALKILLQVRLQILLGKRPCLAPLIRPLNLNDGIVGGHADLIVSAELWVLE